jgi:hypothetical protein
MYRNRFTKPLHLGRSPINLKMHPILWHITAVILSAYNYLLCTFIKTLCAHNPHKLSLFFITKAQWVRSLDLALSYNLQAVVGSNTLVQLTSLSPIRRGFAPGFVNYKKGALDSQPHVIKFTSCLPMVGGFNRVLRIPPPLKLVAMI